MSTNKTLVLGGARSGKTARALNLCKPFENRLYIATAQPGDDEMKERIDAHQKQRGKDWSTLEAPISLPKALDDLQSNTQPNRVVLVDCLTLWLSNLILAGHDITSETETLIAATQSFTGTLVFVSNEVGQGIVPDNQLARQFRDAQGLLNQRIAATVDVVEFVTAGLPMRLKP